MPTPKISPPKNLQEAPENISVKSFFHSCGDALKLKLIASEEGLTKIIKEKSINRPALALTGYFKHFANKRLQLFGAGEMRYLKDLKEPMQQKVLSQMAQKTIPCIVISRNLTPTKPLLNIAKEYHIPLFRTPLKSKDFSAEATILLEDLMAPRTSLHGTLIDLRGIGVLIRGESGIGKSECALALVERGNSLVADDIVYIKLLAENELTGSGSKLNQGYMECRGIGIINVAELFGIRSVRLKKRIDLVITFKEWSPGMHEERTGLDQNYFEILGKPVPHVEIPVRPGRDMSRLVEVAAMVQALKLIGHDSAKEFNKRLIHYMQKQEVAERSSWL